MLLLGSTCPIGGPLRFGEGWMHLAVKKSYKNNKAKSTAKIVIKGKGSFGGEKVVEFRVG